MCLNLAVNKTELAIKTIKECGLNIQQVADKLGVHRNQIHRWLKGNTVIRDSNLFEIGKMIGKKPSFEGNEVFWVDYDKKEIELTAIDTKEESVAIEMERIKLNAKKEFEQKDKLINYQEQEIEELKRENKQLRENPIQRVRFDSLEYDWMSTVDIRIGIPLQRKIYNLKNIKILADKLGLDEIEIKEYFDIGNYHAMNKHPIDKIITKQSLKSLKEETGFFTDMLKKGARLGALLTGMGYMTLLVDYEYKNKHCKTITNCKIIEAGRTVKILNKIQLLKD